MESHMHRGYSTKSVVSLRQLHSPYILLPLLSLALKREVPPAANSAIISGVVESCLLR